MTVPATTGFLIHIDGALTTEYDAVDPKVDKRLLERLQAMLYDDARIALITGRSQRWLERHLVPLIDYNNFLILGEYGNFRIWQGEQFWDDRATTFQDRYREQLKTRIADVAKRHGIATRIEDRDYEPKGGELWFAPAVGVLPVRTNPHGHTFGTKVDADIVYKITREAIRESGAREDEFDVKKTPVSTVVTYKSVNLEAAARMAVSTLDPDDYVEKWYAFGRSMDESMAFDPKVQFVCVGPKASRDTWDFLSKLD